MRGYQTVMLGYKTVMLGWPKRETLATRSWQLMGVLSGGIGRSPPPTLFMVKHRFWEPFLRKLGNWYLMFSNICHDTSLWKIWSKFQNLLKFEIFEQILVKYSQSTRITHTGRFAQFVSKLVEIEIFQHFLVRYSQSATLLQTRRLDQNLLKFEVFEDILVRH